MKKYNWKKLSSKNSNCSSCPKSERRIDNSSAINPYSLTVADMIKVKDNNVLDSNKNFPSLANSRFAFTDMTD